MASFTSHLFLHSGAAAYCSCKRPTYTISPRPHFTRREATVLSLKNSQGNTPLEFSGKQMRFSRSDQFIKRRDLAPIPVSKAAEAEPPAPPFEKFQLLLTISLCLIWYLLSTILHSFTRKIYLYFPFPFFLSAVQLFAGVNMCILNWAFGSRKRAPITKDLLKVIAPIAVFHTIVHIMSNFYSSVRIDPLIKTALDPVISALPFPMMLFQLITGYLILLLILLLCVALALLAIGAIIFTIFLTCRNICSKKAMQRLDSTNLYAYVSIISLVFCLPLAILIEGPTLKNGLSRAIAKVGMLTILSDLCCDRSSKMGQPDYFHCWKHIEHDFFIYLLGNPIPRRHNIHLKVSCSLFFSDIFDYINLSRHEGNLKRNITWSLNCHYWCWHLLRLKGNMKETKWA
ncbi:triose phosphate/phosphate translocator, chloroplastic [Artemisia annua]|uniref:Triose phosphate/phosphate translocator, chloroplastic n=1 Tax=Artemisia annua TaxID=35608 RepID=A0A2U1MX79_ARTAN|nr:triose phosphate/phosphate translocator, chloroplastic [Artemisia annua]